MSSLCSATNESNAGSEDDGKGAVEEAEASLDIVEEEASLAISVAEIEDVEEQGAEEDGAEAEEDGAGLSESGTGTVSMSKTVSVAVTAAESTGSGSDTKCSICRVGAASDTVVRLLRAGERSGERSTVGPGSGNTSA